MVDSLWSRLPVFSRPKIIVLVENAACACRRKYAPVSWNCQVCCPSAPPLLSASPHRTGKTTPSPWPRRRRPGLSSVPHPRLRIPPRPSVAPLRVVAVVWLLEDFLHRPPGQAPGEGVSAFSRLAGWRRKTLESFGWVRATGRFPPRVRGEWAGRPFLLAGEAAIHIRGCGSSFVFWQPMYQASPVYGGPILRKPVAQNTTVCCSRLHSTQNQCPFLP